MKSRLFILFSLLLSVAASAQINVPESIRAGDSLQNPGSYVAGDAVRAARFMVDKMDTAGGTSQYFVKWDPVTKRLHMQKVDGSGAVTLAVDSIRHGKTNPLLSPVRDSWDSVYWHKNGNVYAFFDRNGAENFSATTYGTIPYGAGKSWVNSNIFTTTTSSNNLQMRNGVATVVPTHMLHVNGPVKANGGLISGSRRFSIISTPQQTVNISTPDGAATDSLTIELHEGASGSGRLVSHPFSNGQIDTIATRAYARSVAGTGGGGGGSGTMTGIVAGKGVRLSGDASVNPTVGIDSIYTATQYNRKQDKDSLRSEMATAQSLESARKKDSVVIGSILSNARDSAFVYTMPDGGPSLIIGSNPGDETPALLYRWGSNDECPICPKIGRYSITANSFELRSSNVSNQGGVRLTADNNVAWSNVNFRQRIGASTSYVAYTDEVDSINAKDSLQTVLNRGSNYNKPIRFNTSTNDTAFVANRAGRTLNIVNIGGQPNLLSMFGTDHPQGYVQVGADRMSAMYHTIRNGYNTGSTGSVTHTMTNFNGDYNVYWGPKNGQGALVEDITAATANLVTKDSATLERVRQRDSTFTGGIYYAGSNYPSTAFNIASGGRALNMGLGINYPEFTYKWSTAELVRIDQDGLTARQSFRIKSPQGGIYTIQVANSTTDKLFNLSSAGEIITSTNIGGYTPFPDTATKLVTRTRYDSSQRRQDSTLLALYNGGGSGSSGVTSVASKTGAVTLDTNDIGGFTGGINRLRALVDQRLKYADTAAMLSPYAAAIGLRMRYSDTAAMLSPWYSLINARLKVSDTGWMLNPYARAADYYTKTAADARYLQSYSETDPTVSAAAKSITSGDVSAWNGKQSQLNGTGFVQMAGTTPSYVATVPVANGGTGATSAPGARTALGLGTSAVLDVASSGDAASGQVVKGNDTRLTDARPASTIAGKVTAGANMTRTGSGTTADPYVFSSTATGGGTDTTGLGLATRDQVAAANTVSRARANHTGTQTAATISDFASAVQAVGDPRYLQAYTETDPTVSAAAKAITSGDVASWNGKQAQLSGTGFVQMSGATPAYVATVPLTAGGTGATSAAAARTALGLGTGAVLDAPASGDAATGQVVKGNDTRLSDARTPTAHTHSAADLTSGLLPAGRIGGTAADGKVVKYISGVLLYSDDLTGAGGTIDTSAQPYSAATWAQVDSAKKNLRTEIAAAGGGSGGSSNWTLITKSTIQYNSSTTMTDVTDMNFPITAGKRYDVRIQLMYRTNGSVTMNLAEAPISTNGYGRTIVRSTTAATLIASASGTASSMAAASSAAMAYMTVSFYCTASGIYKLQYATGTSGTAVEFHAGSILEYREF